MARAMQLKMESVGFEVESAFDGEEAIEKILNGKFDLVLLDLVIPKKDGFTVLETVKGKVQVPIIVTSNLSQPQDEQKAKDLGAQGYIIKSNTPLLKIVEQVTHILSA